MSVCDTYQCCPHERSFDLASGELGQRNNRALDVAIRYLLPRISDDDCVRLRKPMHRWRTATEAFLLAPVCPIIDRKYSAAWMRIYADTPRPRRDMVQALYIAIHHHIDALLRVIREEEHRHWWALFLLFDYMFPGTGDRLSLRLRAQREARHA